MNLEELQNEVEKLNMEILHLKSFNNEMKGFLEAFQNRYSLWNVNLIPIEEKVLTCGGWKTKEILYNTPFDYTNLLKK